MYAHFIMSIADDSLFSYTEMVSLCKIEEVTENNFCGSEANSAFPPAKCSFLNNVVDSIAY